MRASRPLSLVGGMSAVELSEAQLDALAMKIAARVAESLAGPYEPQSAPSSLQTAAQLAARLGVSVRYVREHADQLGAIRIGSGTKPRLRFPADAGAKLPDTVAAGSRPRPRRTAARNQPGSVLAIRGAA